MRKPNDSLDDFVVKPDPDVTVDPPREVSLRLTGEVQTLQPLTERAKSLYATRVRGRYQPLWFRRVIAVGSGALAMMAFVLISAIIIGINEPVAGPDVVMNSEPANILRQAIGLDIYSTPDLEPAADETEAVRPSLRRRFVRPTIQAAAYKPRRQYRPRPHSEEPKFVPTTLVIYAENGVINSRIEPWLQAGLITHQ